MYSGVVAKIGLVGLDQPCKDIGRFEGDERWIVFQRVFSHSALKSLDSIKPSIQAAKLAAENVKEVLRKRFASFIYKRS